MNSKVSDRQLEVLRWIAGGCPDGKWADGDHYFKVAAGALQSRGLVTVHKRRNNWSAIITEAGEHFTEHSDYPPGHRFSKLDLTPVARTYDEPQGEDAGGKGLAKSKPEPPTRPTEFEIDSPRRLREREDRQAQAKQGAKTRPVHPWDDKVLVSAKEAAWVLSLTEGMVRQAVRDGDVQRVFIGEGKTHYRIVYQSLLAWVDCMPRESPRYYS